MKIAVSPAKGLMMPSARMISSHSRTKWSTSHGFPTPMIDWYYTAGRLRRGGLLVVDDVHLPAVAMLVGVLDRDDRWRPIRRTKKWVAYERAADGPLREDWYQQSFVPEWGLPRPLARRVLNRALRLVSRG